MKVVTPISAVQNVSFRTRTIETLVTLGIREEGTDLWSNYDYLGVFENGYLTLPVEHPFEEGKKYQFLVYGNGNNVIWRGQAFATSQAADLYRLHPELI